MRRHWSVTELPTAFLKLTEESVENRLVSMVSSYVFVTCAQTDDIRTGATTCISGYVVTLLCALSTNSNAVGQMDVHIQQ